jgi:hypothetical protein
MKFHRIKPTTGALIDPYNQRMVSHTEEEGFVTNEIQANHLIHNNLAVMIEANVDGPNASPAAAPEPVKRAGKKKIDDELV